MSSLFNNPDDILIHTISMWQPWANALVTPHANYPDRGIKEYETRSWSTTVRGRILIHAAKTWGKGNKDLMLTNTAFSMLADQLLPLHFGGIIGSVDITGIIASEEFIAKGHLMSETPVTELALGDWSENRYGWICEKPVLFKEPIPYKGQQGYWKVPLSIVPKEYWYLFTDHNTNGAEEKTESAEEALQ